MYMPYYSPLQSAPPRQFSSEVRRFGLRDVTRFMRRSASVIIATTLAFVALGVAYVLTVPPSYRASALLMVENRRASYYFSEPNFSAEPVTDQTRVESQIQVLRSEQIAAAVVQRLHLEEKPEFAPHPSPLLAWLGVADALTAAREWFDRLRPRPQSASDSRQDYARQVFAQNLSVKRMGLSLVIEVAFRADDPALSAEVVNAVLTAYRDADVSAKSALADQGRKWLSGRLNELQQAASAARLDLEQFKRTAFKSDGGTSQAQLSVMTSMAQSRQQVYEAFLQKYNEAAQKVSFPEPDSSVVATAIPPMHPTPSATLVLAFAGLLGVTLGGGISLARASTDRRIRSPGQISREAGVDCLGTVAHVPVHRRRKTELWSRGPARTSANTPSGGRLSPMLRMAIDRPSANLSRDLRAIRTFVNNATARNGPRSIGVVAPRKGQGATTVASNLALVYALSGEPTLLVDACIDDPVISRAFGRPSQLGLMEILDDPENLSGVIRDESDCGFAVLPIGKSSALVSPGDIIASRNAEFQIAKLKNAFKVVIFDLPAISDSPDALALGHHLDAILIVVTKNSISLDELSDCARSLNNGSDSVLGVVINKWEGGFDD
jgi:polysaccharide biosynthesis transport protein